MSTIQKTDKLLQQLIVLTTEEIDLVIDFVEFLQYKKGIQQGIQSQSQAKKDSEPMALSKFWEQWFAEVDRLEVSLTEPSSEYEEGLLAKYRQQGLDL
jgi:hypothetical protein